MKRIRNWLLIDKHSDHRGDDLDFYHRREGFYRAMYYLIEKERKTDMIDTTEYWMQIAGTIPDTVYADGIKTSSVIGLQRMGKTQEGHLVVAYTYTGSTYEVLFEERDEFQWRSMISALGYRNIELMGEPIGYKRVSGIVIPDEQSNDPTIKFKVPGGMM